MLVDEVGTAAWLEAEGARLLAFPRGPYPRDGGAYWLDDYGRPDIDGPIETWITARTAYVYALASLAAVPGSVDRASTALRGLSGPLHDADHGGWRESTRSTVANKTAYAHASVLLGATAAVHAGIEGASAVFDEVMAMIDQHLWDERAGMARDTMSSDWSQASDYRGLNANMHMVEAFLAVSDERVPGIRQRALEMCRRVAGWASENDWRIPEHFDESWNPHLDLGAEYPADPFKPFGSTPGHGFEWSRLMAGAATAASATDRGWLMEAAVAIYDRSARDGWARNGHPGFVYTVDWGGRPVVDARLFWVAAEAVGAADVLARSTGDQRYVADRSLWWHYIDDHLIDRDRGSWIHELDAENRPATTIWRGKPDLYHAYQACLIPRVPLSPSVLESVERAKV